jgi:hypothetical protein
MYSEGGEESRAACSVRGIPLLAQRAREKWGTRRLGTVSEIKPKGGGQECPPHTDRARKHPRPKLKRERG